MQPIQMWRASIEPILSPSWGVLRVRVATVGHLHFCNRVSLTQLLPSMRLLNYLIGFMKAYWKSMPKHEFESENGTPAGEASRIVIAVQTYQERMLGTFGADSSHLTAVFSWGNCWWQGQALWRVDLEMASARCNELLQNPGEDHGSACQLSPPRKTLRTTALKTARLSKTQNNPGDNVAAWFEMVWG